MLAQILHDLYVPRELLNGLPEDQKQLLFCKMREEQIRRYYEREDEEKEKAINTLKSTHKRNKIKKNNKRVTFRLGVDGTEWCRIMGESEISSKTIDEYLHDKINDENEHHNHRRAIAGANHTTPTKTGSFYTVHRDERKQIEEISNNIQEARRIFERLESDTRRLVLNKESEVLQQKKSSSLPQIPQSDIVDEIFYREIEERAKQADRERREVARRARDSYLKHSSQLNVCFDTDNHTTILQPPPLNSSNKSNPPINEKKIHIEFVEKKPLKLQSSSMDNLRKEPIEQEKSPTTPVEHPRSKPLLPLTREDIRQWFCTREVPYSTFRSPNGQIYLWFHGIISRAYTEQLLSSKPIGTYLIRINEKIYGYALSYRASDHCRHLLIEVILAPKRDHNQVQQHVYRFLGGAKHEIFTQLNDLIEKYSNTPIRSNSNDVLRYPCGQVNPQKPDYADLFTEYSNNKKIESLYIQLETTTSPPPQSNTQL
ncbi:unnamed protein product [Adineta steineri]|uniref:SH2 domain-containing protein n=1 Tax=Adineta steineri TaxID=433720 RepID=A0A819BX84_9BILA|nr:unnamed protein product [Adineta steineri]